jgi:hypothetical protein
MGGIYEVRRLDGLGCRNTHTEFYKDWFRHSKVNRGRFTENNLFTLLAVSLQWPAKKFPFSESC